MTPQPSFFDGPAPLPGTESPRRALFVDRWGTLLQEPEGGPGKQLGEPKFFPGALDHLFRACQAGWTIYLIGNEDSVARGRTSGAEWERFEQEMLAALRSAGVDVARNYACLDHPEHGKGKHLRDSVFLLPNTGAMYHARQHDGIHLAESWVIGDSTLELAAGWRAGCRTAGVHTGRGLGDAELEIDTEFDASDLASALEEVQDLTRSRMA